MKNIFTTGSAMLLACTLIFLGCDKKDDPQPQPQPEAQGTAGLAFEGIAGSQDFTLNTTYTSPQGENFRVSKLRYYVSNVVLEKVQGGDVAFNQYFLADFSKPESLDLDLGKVDTGRYKAIRFSIGVDSARNYSGDQIGALDVANGMFWTWNSGYIFMQFEGTRPDSANKPFIYHYGGSKAANNTLRTVRFDLSNTPLVVKGGKESHVHAQIDPLVLLTGVSFVSRPSTHMASFIANNVPPAISLDHVHNAQ